MRHPTHAGMKQKEKPRSNLQVPHAPHRRFDLRWAEMLDHYTARESFGHGQELEQQSVRIFRSAWVRAASRVNVLRSCGSLSSASPWPVMRIAERSLRFVLPYAPLPSVSCPSSVRVSYPESGLVTSLCLLTDGFSRSVRNCCCADGRRREDGFSIYDW
jgi:hypothetical protein